MLTQLFNNLLTIRRRSATSVLENTVRNSSDTQSMLPTAPRYPLIGIVTPVRNRRHWTIDFAKTLCKQDYPLFKFYVVDSQSTDGTPKALHELGLAPIVVLEAPERAYWTEATNIGVRRALEDGCEYILTINDDAIISERYLTTIVEATLKNDALICGSVISYADNPGRLWGVGAYNNWSSGAFLQLSMANIWDDAIPDEAVSNDALVSVDYLCGNGTLIHRSVFDIVGLYDAKHTPHYHADSEFTMRVERAGIPRWVAARARLFNRFSELGDGSFAARNQKLFSLRSANYAPAVLYVLDQYCPQDLKATALVRYFTQRVHQEHWRSWSRMLRIVSFLAKPAQERSASSRHFFPPTDEAICIAEDLEILLSLPDREFCVMLYAYLLRRAGSDEEHATRLTLLANNFSRDTLVREFINSGEFANRQRMRQQYTLALHQLRSQPEAFVPPAMVSPHEQWILTSLAREGRAPTQAELRKLQNTNSITPVQESNHKTFVFMNIDVLCMATVDPKAATGVYRYVLNIFKELMANPGIELRVFHAPELEQAAAKLREPRGQLANAIFSPQSMQEFRGVVFYPYFPFNRKDPRFAGLPEVVMIHDLFPLTNPEWFSSAAVSNFRRQLHDIVDTDHLICNSFATEAQIRSVFPGRRWPTTVAHPGVDATPNSAAGGRSQLASSAATIQRTVSRSLGRAPFFLCVGTIEPRKNLSSVIKALALLKRPGVGRLQMLVVGQEGWNITSEELNTMAGGESNRIRFLGRVSEKKLWSLYRDAVCTVFPSRAEGFGFPIIESMSCGTPVVTSDGSSMREIAQKGAILIDPLNPSAIAAAIEKIATDHALRKRLSIEATEHAGLYTWRKCADVHIREFTRLSQLSPDRRSKTPVSMRGAF